METFIYLPFGYSCPHCSTLFPSIFSSSMYNFPPSVTTPPTLDPLFELRVAPAHGARPSSPLALWSPPLRQALTENVESGFEKGTKREKLLVRIPSNPWPPSEPGISRSIGDTPIRLSALAMANNTGACREPSWLMRGWEEEQKVCVVLLVVVVVVGGGRLHPPQFRWCDLIGVLH